MVRKKKGLNEADNGMGRRGGTRRKLNRTSSGIGKKGGKGLRAQIQEWIERIGDRRGGSSIKEKEPT